MFLQTTYTAPIGHTVTVQWYLDDVALVDGTFGEVVISGAFTSTVLTEEENTATLNIQNPTAAYDGIYHAVITDLDVDDCVRQTSPVDVTVPAICRLEITVQPVPVETSAGNTVQLTLAYTGAAGAVTIQWYKDDVPLVDGGNVNGATTATLTITNSVEADSGSYYAIVTDTGILDCVLQTNTVAVVVNADCDLLVTTQPEGGTFLNGDAVELTFAYTGSGGPFTIQWYRNGVAIVDGASGSSTIAGATTDTLTITNWTDVLEGSFHAVVTDTSVADCVAQTEAVLVEHAGYPVSLADFCGAYSFVRKLDSAYAGSAFRVRRSSDSSELDIGFVGDYTDIATLTAFVGAGTGRITVLFNQGGACADLQITPEDQQPKIIVAGVLQVDANGLPWCYFDGTLPEADNLITSVGGGNPTHLCVFQISNHVSGAVLTSGVSAPNTSIQLLTSGGNRLALRSDIVAAGPVYNVGQQYLVTAHFDNAVGVNDTIQLNNGAVDTLNAGTQGSGGFFAISNALNGFDGYLSEVYFYHGVVPPAELLLVQDNINSLFQLW